MTDGTGRRKSVNPPSLAKPTTVPRGPKLFRLNSTRGQVSIFVAPPPGFVIGTTSASEWILYAALAKVLGVPQDPTEPPYEGYPGVWGYQANLFGGRHSVGGAVADYVVYGSTRRAYEAVLIRLQTEQFHYFTTAAKQNSDRYQMIRMMGVARTIDIQENDILGDPSGEKACRVVADYLSGFDTPNPLDYSAARRARGLWRPGK